MNTKVHGSKLELSRIPLKEETHRFPVLKYNQAAFRSHAGWFSAILTESVEVILQGGRPSFASVREVLFERSNCTVDTERKFQRPALRGPACPAVPTSGL